MSKEDTKLRDCFHINEFTAQDLKKVFKVYGETHDVSHVELGFSPDRWVKIVFGKRLPKICEGEAIQSEEVKE